MGVASLAFLVALRQCDDKARIAAGVIQCDGSLVIVDNGLRDTETKTGTASDGFGGEKRVEDPFGNVIGDAVSTVGDFEGNRLALLEYANFDPALRQLLDGVAGIENKIDEHL